MCLILLFNCKKKSASKSCIVPTWVVKYNFFLGKLIGQIKRHERILKHARPDFQKQLQTWAPDQVASNQRPYFIQNHQLPTFQPSLHHHNMFIEHSNPPQGVGLRPPLEPPPRVPERPLPVPLEALIPPPSLHGPPRIPPPQKVLINREYKGGIINGKNVSYMS